MTISSFIIQWKSWPKIFVFIQLCFVLFCFLKSTVWLIPLGFPGSFPWNVEVLKAFRFHLGCELRSHRCPSQRPWRGSGGWRVYKGTGSLIWDADFLTIKMQQLSGARHTLSRQCGRKLPTIPPFQWHAGVTRVTGVGGRECWGTNCWSYRLSSNISDDEGVQNKSF